MKKSLAKEHKEAISDGLRSYWTSQRAQTRRAEPRSYSTEYQKWKGKLTVEEIRAANKKSYYRHHEARRLYGNQYRQQQREQAIQLILLSHNAPYKCMVLECQITDKRILEINHLLNAPKLHGKELHGAIIHGQVDLSKFDIRCSNHNKLYEYEVGRNFVGARY